MLNQITILSFIITLPVTDTFFNVFIDLNHNLNAYVSIKFWTLIWHLIRERNLPWLAIDRKLYSSDVAISWFSLTWLSLWNTFLLNWCCNRLLFWLRCRSDSWHCVYHGSMKGWQSWISLLPLLHYSARCDKPSESFLVCKSVTGTHTSSAKNQKV